MAVPVPPPDSITSEYSVPWTRNPTPSSLAASSSKTRMNSVADDLALLLRIGDALQPREEALLGVDGDSGTSKCRGTRRPPARPRSCASDRDRRTRRSGGRRSPVDEQRGDARIDAAGEAADRASVPTCARIALDLLLDHRARAPGALAAADVTQEVRQHLLPVRRVDHLGVELDPVDPALARTRTRRPARRSTTRARRNPPAPRTRCRDATSSRSAPPASPPAARPLAVDAQLRAPELADLGALDAAAELACDQLHPVTDTQHRDPELEQRRIELRRALRIDRRGATGQDHAVRAGGAPPRRRRRGGAAASRRRRTRAPGARSAASTARRSRAPRPPRWRWSR